jgi:hypothetical protein
MTPGRHLGRIWALIHHLLSCDHPLVLFSFLSSSSLILFCFKSGSPRQCFKPYWYISSLVSALFCLEGAMCAVVYSSSTSPSWRHGGQQIQQDAWRYFIRNTSTRSGCQDSLGFKTLVPLYTSPSKI